MRGIIHIEDETFITDRNNEARVPVERVDLRPTWDIDRAGSKGQVSVTADADVLEPGMWLSTYRTITPERGEIIRFPRGHWHLSRPGIAYPGGHETDSGNVAVMQTASGSDIVDDIAGVMLTEAFYTPVGGHVMQDVRVLLKMATAGILGPNLLTNGGFENGLAGWSGPIFELGASGVYQSTIPQFGGIPPEGQRLYAVLTDGSLPVGARVFSYQDIELPPGAQMVYLSAEGFVQYPSERLEARVSYRTGSGATIASDSLFWEYPAGEENAQRWVRKIGVFRVRDDAVSVRIHMWTHRTIAGAGSSRSAFDDIRVGTCTMMPLPDDRINLPQSDALASTRIQTDEGKIIAYDAINADRLGAISHNAIATDMDGRLTTQPVRTLANATPRYTFGPGEIDLLDVVAPEISAISEKPYNHWRAVKEDFQDAALSIAADSYNNNPNDPFSVISSGSVHSAPLITVQDAVSEAALQAMADAARDRYSLSETVRFAIMPIAEINVYDVVEIADPEMPEINGVWALNSIDASGDYLVITATRAVSREV